MSVHTSLIGALWGPVSQGILVNLEQRALFGCRVLSSLTAAPQLPAPEHTGQRRRLWVGPGWQPVTAHEEPGPSPRVAAARLSCWPVAVPGHCLATSAVAAEQAAAQRLYSSERFADDHFDRHYRVNTGIFSRALQVFEPDGTSKIMSRRDALKRAAQLRLDLVEFKLAKHGTHTEYPIAKLVNYRHMREQALTDLQQVVADRAHSEARPRRVVAQPESSSQGQNDSLTGDSEESSTTEEGAEKHRSKKARKDARPAKAKQIFLSAKIAPHDIAVRVKQVRKMLEQGHTVRLSKQIDGQQSQQSVSAALDSIAEQLSSVGTAKKAKEMTTTLVTITIMPRQV